MDDDIDFSLIMNPHGWTTLLLYQRGITHEIIASGVLSDPFYEFTSLLLALLNNENEHTLTWFNEPGWHMIRITGNLEQHNLLSIETGYSTNKEPRGFEKKTAFIISQKQFLITGLYQLKKTYHLLQEKSFAQTRKGEFPHALYQTLLKKVAEVIPEIL